MTAFESYFNYEVHTMSDRWFVRVEVSDGKWVEEDIIDPNFDNANLATLTETDDAVISDTLTVSPAHRSYGFAGQFLWDETTDAIDRALNAALAL